MMTAELETENAPTAKAYLKVRHKNVRAVMKKMGIDALLLTSSQDVAYLSNFSAPDNISVYGILTRKDFFLVASRPVMSEAQHTVPWATLLPAPLNAAIKATKAKRIGFEVKSITFGLTQDLDRQLKNGTPTELVPVDGVMPEIRKFKGDYELDSIRKAVTIAEEAFRVMVAEVRVGHEENYLAGFLIGEMRGRGAGGISFDPIVAAGVNSSFGHHSPNETKVQVNQPLLVDWGATYNGYCSDLTRTLIVGRGSPKIRKIYEVVLEAHAAAVNVLRPGVTTRQADRVARNVIELAGYGQYFTHSLGHGIGREVHERPFISAKSDEDELKPGMVVAIEPGIYVPGVGGVRIEDDALITYAGNELLSTLGRTLEENQILQ